MERPFDLEEYAVQHFAECAPLSPLEIHADEPDAGPELDKLKFYLRSALARAEAQEDKINYVSLPRTNDEIDEFEKQLKTALNELDQLRKKLSSDDS